MTSEMVALGEGDLRAVIGREIDLVSRAWAARDGSGWSPMTVRTATEGASHSPPDASGHRTPTLLGSAELSADLIEVSRARGLVRELLGSDHPGCHGVELCACELVTNSLVHTGTDSVSLSVFLARDDRAICIEVGDSGTPGKTPHMRPAAPDNDWYEEGRGLCVVDALTGGRWGTWTDEAGRTTWAVVTF